MIVTLTLKNYNAVVNDSGINLKKITMPQSVTVALLICMLTWLGHTSLIIILIFNLF